MNYEKLGIRIFKRQPVGGFFVSCDIFQASHHIYFKEFCNESIDDILEITKSLKLLRISTYHNYFGSVYNIILEEKKGLPSSILNSSSKLKRRNFVPVFTQINGKSMYRYNLMTHLSDQITEFGTILNEVYPKTFLRN